MGITRNLTEREHIIRTENRYVLHPKGHKRCTQCEKVYDNIRLNFDIRRKNKDGTTAYEGGCKKCKASQREQRVIKQKLNIESYSRTFLASVRCRAQQCGVPFDLDVDFLVGLWNHQNGNCFYTGNQLDLSAKTKTGKSPHLNFPSLDRKVPDLGYTKDNVVWTSWGVNRMKSNLPHNQFIEFCHTIVSRFSENAK